MVLSTASYGVFQPKPLWDTRLCYTAAFQASLQTTNFRFQEIFLLASPMLVKLYRMDGVGIGMYIGIITFFCRHFSIFDKRLQVPGCAQEITLYASHVPLAVPQRPAVRSKAEATGCFLGCDTEWQQTAYVSNSLEKASGLKSRPILVMNEVNVESLHDFTAREECFGYLWLIAERWEFVQGTAPWIAPEFVIRNSCCG